MSEMAQTADHLLVIGRGRLIADASMDEFVNRNATASVRVRAVAAGRRWPVPEPARRRAGQPPDGARS